MPVQKKKEREELDRKIESETIFATGSAAVFILSSLAFISICLVGLTDEARVTNYHFAILVFIVIATVSFGTFVYSVLRHRELVAQRN